jgi:uroporphyrinogen decarboxylase
MMTDKQNAMEILRFGKPDRVVGGMPAHWIGYFGVNHEGFDAPDAPNGIPVGRGWTDIWGVRWEKEYAGVMGFPKGPVLADLPAALRTYHWPDPYDDRLCRQIYEQAANADREKLFLCGSHRCTLWEAANKLVGMEDLMCFFHTEPAAVRDLLQRMMDFQLGIASHYLKVGVDMVFLAEDLGTQTGLLLSPAIIDEFLVPQYRRLFDLYKKHNVLIFFHSCGHVMPILNVLMDLGVDCLNPIQASANDFDQMRRITQGRMAFWGGVSSGLIVTGPTDAIRQEVRRCLRLLGTDGGYFCSPDQEMPFPREHIEAFWEAVNQYGAYPLC